MGVDLVLFNAVFRMNIHVRHQQNDIQIGVGLSPLSNFDKIEKFKMDAIKLYAFIQNDISRKVVLVELEW